MFTIIIPILYLTEYSRATIFDIKNKIILYPQIKFIFSCYFTVDKEIIKILGEVEKLPNVKILFSNIKSSNYLRKNPINYIDTSYVYYQDCDDYVIFENLINDYKYCNGNNIICFNIRKKICNNNGTIEKEYNIYSIKEGQIKNIRELPTNIVNKFIPLKFLKKIIFYNIPFSQDVSISYQLFNLCQHFYVNNINYIYILNNKSTSGIKKTEYKSLLRVKAVEHLLCKQIEDKKILSWIKFRYELLIQQRFVYLNKLYFPKLNFHFFNVKYFGFKAFFYDVYHFINAYIIFIKSIINIIIA